MPVYKMMKDMNSRGKIINTEWLIPAPTALGDHIGFTAGVKPEAITAVVISKIIAGVLAIAVAMMMMIKSTEAEDMLSEAIAKADTVKA